MKRIVLLLTLLLALGMLTAEQINVGSYQNDIRLIQDNPNNMVMELTLGHFERQTVQIDGDTWYYPTIKNGGITLESGLPQLPVMAGSVIIPNTAMIQLETIHSEYVEMVMPIAPSKGNLTRDINPETVPFQFDALYSSNQSWPVDNTELSEPFIIRDFRGITVRFIPFSYFPATQTLRVYTKIQVALNNVGTDLTNSLPFTKTAYSAEFAGIYENLFLNFGAAKYPSLGEEGRILVIKHNMFDASIIPWVEWKRQNGYRVDVVDVTVAGPTAANIKTYIQNQYDLDDGLMFVQIMGDAPQVPTLSSGGGGSDPSYALLAGNDNYPDIYVGRFSAQNVGEMDTQVQKVVGYERDAAVGETWMQKGMGIASNEGGGGQGDNGESDQQHMEIIRGKLLNYGYLSVDQMYQTQGATAAQVSSNLNAGRGFINYVGHGSDTSWVTTGFNNTHVNALTNDNMLPFIVSVACVNGNFVSQTCFAEAWLRAKNNTTGAPTGAVAMYASTVNQSWAPPMRGQDEVTDLLVVEAKRTIGGLFFNGSSKMTEVYGNNGASEYKNWHIFGDASMMARTKEPMALTVEHTPVLFMGMDTFIVDTAPDARVTLYADGVVYAHAVSNAAGTATLILSDPPMEPMDLTLTVTAFNYQTHISTVQLLPASGPYIIVTGMNVNDVEDNHVMYGETINLGFEFNNLGSEDAEGINVAISSSSPHISILNTDEDIADIPADAYGNTVNGFNIRISNSAPDQHVATINILITLTNGEEYSYNRNIIIDAPKLTWGILEIDDVFGNNNGRIDPGESITLSFPVTNAGHATSDDIITTLVINDGRHVADALNVEFIALLPDGTANMEYMVTFSSQIVPGTTIHMTAMLFSGEYTEMKTYSVKVGEVVEDFESGFGNLPWTFAGGNWTIVDDSYNASMAARSAAINNNQTTSMTLYINCPDDGTISFWKKVSSEQNYDFLKFYINGTLKDQWSGTQDVWQQVTYTTQAGNNSFKWEYSKDYTTAQGQDCAWIDDIILPIRGEIPGTPVIVMETEDIDFGTILLGDTAQVPVTINNDGDAVLIGTMHTTAPFHIIDGGGNEVESVNLIIQPGSFVQFDVRYTPTQIGSSTGDLLVNTDDPENSIIILSLSGTAQPVSNDDSVITVITELQGNFPNPFNPTTSINYSLKEAGAVKIEIYNLKGQLVKTLVNEIKNAGNHNIIWNGQDAQGRAVSSGIYLYRMEAGTYRHSQKMIMMK